MSVKAIVLSSAAAIAILAPQAAQAAWTKSYVVEWFESAFHFGAQPGTSPDAPGTDCPQGANDLDQRKELSTPFRTKEQVDTILNPENGLLPLQTSFAFRGLNMENVYENPTTAPDPGFKEVQSKIAEGFNLDGDETTGFTSPTGEKGIDHAYYKAAGCVRRWRGDPRTSSTGKFHNEGMHNGAYTVLFVVSGEGDDPMNDENVTVGVYSSQDKLVKDASGVVATDYTYRVDPKAAFQTVFSARVRDGVLEQKQPFLLKAHDHMQGFYDRPGMELSQTHVRMKMQPNGSMQGLIGGYRDWYDHFRNPLGNGGIVVGSGGGTVQGASAERLGRFNAVGFYYALRRNADGLKDPETGQNRGISTAYRYYLKPAFVVSPKADEAVRVARIFEG